jgi:lipopolysaccharide/colanic/teichoic acid biosynthesis glycosyltransferase
MKDASRPFGRMEPVPIDASIWTDVAKRAIDLILATILVLILSPVLLVIAIGVAVSSPGPMLFRQERLGRNQVGFVMLKFRTMAEGSDDGIHRAFVTGMFAADEADGGVEDEIHKLTEDPRVTRIGRILRRLSLDELPQLFNVITGHMSMVGPRPALPWEADLFQAHHLVRFDVKPGMTGLWQVSGRSTLTMPQALDLDAEYVARRSFGLDLWILLRTVPVVLAGRGAS